MWKAIVLLCGLYVFINIPTLHDGLFQVYDNVQVTRIQAMYSELQSGQFPVRYLSEFGHGAGYLLFKYYSPLVYYLGAIIMYLGLSGIQALKLIYLMMIAIGASGMYVLSKAKTQRYWPATLASLAFLSAPYLYHDFFHRGTLTEASAMMMIPWTIWAFDKLVGKHSKVNFVLAGFALAIVILTHSLTAVMTLGTLVLYLLFQMPKPRTWFVYFGAILLGFGLSGFSLVPSLAEKHLIRYENNSLLERGYLDHPVALLSQFNNQGVGGEKSAYLGTALLVCLVILIALYLSSVKFRRDYGRLAGLIVVAAVGSLFLISPSSAILWENIIYLRYFQFPFRLLTIATTILSLGVAVIADYFQSIKKQSWWLVAIIVLPIWYNLSYYKPLGYQYGTQYSVDDPCMTSTWADEYLSKWTTKCLLKREDRLVKDLKDPNRIITSTVSEGGRKITFNPEMPGDYLVAKYYFPEWIARTQTESELEISPETEAGIIKVISKDGAPVVLTMEKSDASRIGDWMTITACGISICLLLASLMNKAKSTPAKQRS